MSQNPRNGAENLQIYPDNRGFYLALKSTTSANGDDQNFTFSSKPPLGADMIRTSKSLNKVGMNMVASRAADQRQGGMNGFNALRVNSQTKSQ